MEFLMMECFFKHRQQYWRFSILIFKGKKRLEGLKKFLFQALPQINIDFSPSVCRVHSATGEARYRFVMLSLLLSLLLLLLPSLLLFNVHVYRSVVYTNIHLLGATGEPSYRFITLLLLSLLNVFVRLPGTPSNKRNKISIYYIIIISRTRTSIGGDTSIIHTLHLFGRLFIVACTIY